MDKGKILVIDDDKDILLTVKVILKKQFSEIKTTTNPNEILSLIKNNSADVILLDMNFTTGATSGEEGMDWLKKIIELNPDATVVMMTAYGDIELAVEAMRIGATDFIVKPWENSRFLATINSAYKHSLSKKEILNLKNKQQVLAKDIDQAFNNIIGESEAMKKVFDTINKVSTTHASILILGENGTGKELIAREIHRNSNRSNNLFLNVDLGAIAENLFESELFGHVKGAFTDAKDNRIGRFELANNGTLFLDEIGNLSLPLQAKLLTAIQNREITPVGSNKSVKTDIRLICATNMPIQQMVETNEFRQDLYFRINTVEIHIPPLRERLDDIDLLASYFLKKLQNKYQKQNLQISNDAIKKLKKYDWPGNIRELQHIIERAVIMSNSNVLSSNDFILNIPASNYQNRLNLNLEEIEKQTIEKALKKHNFNVSAAAKELGLGRTTMYRKMTKYGL